MTPQLGDALRVADRFMMIIGTHKDAERWVRARIVAQLLTVHTTVVPLDFDLLVRAPDFDLAHDIMGIDDHLGPNGWINDGFLPRCAKAVEEPAPLIHDVAGHT